MRPSVFVEDPGERADEFGLTGIRAGDALWCFNEDVARFRGLCVDSIATFVAGIFTRYAPGIRTNFCFVYGSDRCGESMTGCTRCCGLQIPPTAAAELEGLAGALVNYAAGNRLRVRRSRRYYEGGPYWMHVAVRRLEAWWTRKKDGDTLVYATARIPVHEQYFHALLLTLATLPPVSLVVDRQGNDLAFHDVAGEGQAASLAAAMAPYQHGSASWFFRHLRRMMRGGQCSMRMPTPDGREMTVAFESGSRCSVRCSTRLS